MRTAVIVALTALATAAALSLPHAVAQDAVPPKAICTPISPLDDQINTTVKVEAKLNDHLAAGRDHVVTVANGMVLCAW